MMKIAAAFVASAIALWCVPAALAQSSPNLITGQVPTATQWNNFFSTKQDVLGYAPVNKAGDLMTGPLRTFASSAAAAGLRVPPGSAPSVPANGDVWTSTAGMFVRINGATVGPLSGSTSSGFAATAPLAVTFPASVVTYAITGAAGNILAGAGPAFTPTPVLGVAGATVGTLGFENATSGRITLSPPAGALGSRTLTLPAITDTLVGATSPTISNPTFTGSITATGLVTNAALASPSITVNGETCTLGSSCTITTTAGSVTVGTTTIVSGTTTRILYNSAGTLGEYTISGTGTQVAMATGPSLSNPTFTGSVTATGLVTNAALADMANGTVKCRTTAGTGVPENCTQTQIKALGAGSVLQASPADPVGTTNTSGLMMGLGGACLITPLYSTRIKVDFVGSISNSTTSDGAFVQFRIGTGAAPGNAAALTGTAVGPAITFNPTPAGGLFVPFVTTVTVTALSPGTAYWLDLAAGAITAGTASIAGVGCNAHEI